MARTVTVTFEDGTQHVYQNAPDTITPEQVAERAAKDFGKSVKGIDGGRAAQEPAPAKSEGIVGHAKVVPHGFVSGFGGLPAMAVDSYGREAAQANLQTLAGVSAMLGNRKGAEDAARTAREVKGIPLNELTLTSGVNKLANAVGRPPRTTAEGYTHAAALGTGGALLPIPGGSWLRALPRNAVVGASSGLGGETAANLLGDNAFSRILGGVAGGLAPAVLLSKIPNAVNILRRDMSALTDADVARALELEKTLRDNNIKYSSTQLFGDRSTLPDTFERASGNQFVRPRVLGKLSDAPETAVDAVDAWKAANLPPTGATSRGALLDVQEAAASRIRDLREVQANDVYTAAVPAKAASTPIAASKVAQGVQTLRKLAADPNYHGRLSDGGSFLKSVAARLENSAKGTTPLTVGEVNNMVKTLNTLADKSGYKGVALRDAKDILRDMTPEYAAARAAKQKFIQTQVNPVEQGLTGQLAKMGGGVRPDKYTATDSAVSMVINKNRPQPAEIARLAEQINPDNVAALLQEHLSRAQNAALVPTTSTAARIQQPFMIAAGSRGSPRSALRTNVDAALRAAAKSYGVPASELQGSFHKIMDALESFKDLRIASSVDAASIDQAAGRNIASAAIAPLSRTARYIQDAAMASSYKKVADLAMHPDGAKMLIAVGRSKNPSVLPAFIKALAATEAAEQDQQPTP